MVVGVVLRDGDGTGEGEGEGGNSKCSAECVHGYSSGIWDSKECDGVV
jgi:hypothetical protein